MTGLNQAEDPEHARGIYYVRGVDEVSPGKEGALIPGGILS